MPKNSLTRMAIFAAAFVQVLATPPNIGQGNYVYDPNSIPQNEKILKLFVRLAAHTANRLIRLKLKASYPQPTGNGYDVETGPEEEKIASPVPAEGAISSEEYEEDLKDFDLDRRITDEGNKTTSELIRQEKYQTEVNPEEEIFNDKSESILEDTESLMPGEFPSREPFLADEEVDYIADYSELASIPPEITTLVNNVSDVELENRALFNFEKNNYVTHYTDQSTNVNRADTTVNNNGVSQPGKVLVTQETGSNLFGRNESDKRENSFKESGVVVSQVAGSSGFSGSNGVDQSINQNQASTIVGHSGSGISASASFGVDKNVGVHLNTEKLETLKKSAEDVIEKIQKSVKSGLELQKERLAKRLESASFGSNFAQGLQKAVHHLGQESAGVLHGQLNAQMVHSRESNLQESVAAHKREQEMHNFNLKHNTQEQNHHSISTENAAAATSVNRGQIQASFEKSAQLSSQGNLLGEARHNHENGLEISGKFGVNLQHDVQGSIAADKREEELHGFGSTHDVKEQNHHSLSIEDAAAAASANHGQVQASFEKSAQLSSQGNLLGETRHNHESGLEIGGKFGINLQHGAQGSIATDKQDQELHSFGSTHDAQKENHHSLSRENTVTAAATSVNHGQIQGSFEKSAQLSSQGNLLGDIRQNHESGLKVGGQFGVNLQHGAQGSIAADKQDQELHGSGSKHQVKEQNHHSISREDAAAAASANHGQVQASFEKSAQLSSQGNLLGDIRQNHESGLKVGGQFGVNLQHGVGVSSFDSNQSNAIKSAAANDQAGSTLKFEASKGLSAGLGGLLNGKLNIGGFKSKASFDGKLNLAAQVVAAS